MKTLLLKRPHLLVFLFLFSFLISRNLFGQHTHEHSDTVQTAEMDDHMEMTSSFSNNLPMSRDGSATSWQPDATPTMMHMMMKGNTSFMVHGFLFLRYTAQDITDEGTRGGSQFDAPNMFMFVLSQKWKEKNLFSVRTMLSLDPLTVGEDGYPLLFQTGESYQGEPLVDRQHPHDLFSELAVNYTHSFTKEIDVNGYFGYPGEPALGPIVFMHRASAMNNPDAPLGHHWQDATHITFGVGTLGLRYKIIKLEGSIFTGREPDEDRYDFDKPRFDSYSYRVNINPNENFALQFSQGFIESPEALHPEEDIIRTTASVMNTTLLDHDNFIATSLVWGLNHSSEGDNLHSVLLESNLKLKPVTIYGRYEFVQKNAHELNLDLDDNPVFDINAITIGVTKILYAHYIASVALGVQGTINLPDDNLKDIYGNTPLSAQVYLRFSPPPGHVHH